MTASCRQRADEVGDALAPSYRLYSTTTRLGPDMGQAASDWEQGARLAPQDDIRARLEEAVAPLFRTRNFVIGA